MSAATPSPQVVFGLDGPREILDACCGGRMWWWDKEHPLAVYMDVREAPSGSVGELTGRPEWNPNWSCEPTCKGDFRNKWGAGSVKRVEQHFPATPIVGTRSPRGGQTRWFIFYKPLAAVTADPRAHPAAHYPLPDFKACGKCGADARRWVTWDNADGWCCSKCGGCDSDE